MDRSFGQLDDLYREVVLDHYRSPRGRDPISEPACRHEGVNPLCGDEVELAVRLEEDRIADVQLRTRGCAISVASGSMLAEMLPGMTLDEVGRLGDRFREILHGSNGDGTDDEEDLGDLEALRGVSQFPVRIKCALLPWVTLREAIRACKEGLRSPERATSTEEDSP
ncbi:MAG: SUF system NifU family Fe-S cluster assembly protein [Candidatus Eisenbacteria bacterium]|nr:SUF system NifU family Fe-S cluster assembly protein [Candidatus Latescibacterota bacterium]MBD3302895.1 SUF system NifU family Fe-S cluster assembly protein [Candidatus Eisenbacteria bacterium]